MEEKITCPDCKGTGRDEKGDHCQLCLGEGKYYGFEKWPKNKKENEKK